MYSGFRQRPRLGRIQRIPRLIQTARVFPVHAQYEPEKFRRQFVVLRVRRIGMHSNRPPRHLGNELRGSTCRRPPKFPLRAAAQRRNSARQYPIRQRQMISGEKPETAKGHI